MKRSAPRTGPSLGSFPACGCPTRYPSASRGVFGWDERVATTDMTFKNNISRLVIMAIVAAAIILLLSACGGGGGGGY